MTINLNLHPELEAGLLAQAKAEGLSIDQLVSRKLETLARTSMFPEDASNGLAVEADDWETGLDAWLDSFPQRPLLSDEAVTRDSWYPDRW